MNHLGYESVPGPSKEWYKIVGSNHSEARPISSCDMTPMIAYLETFLVEGRADDWNIVLEELKKLIYMDEVDGQIFKHKLGFDDTFGRFVFEQLYDYLQYRAQLQPARGWRCVR